MLTERILVVDSNPVSRKLLVEAVTELGYEVLQAASASEALECSGTSCPDLVLVDVHKNGAGIEGLDLVRDLRSRHPELPSMQLAGTILRVTYARPADFPGLGATITETVDVNVSIPISHQDAEQLYRQGNVVRVIGQLDCRMEVQGGIAVRAKLEEIDTEWAERKTQLTDKLVELRKAESAYRRTRQRFETAARLFVLAGHVELLAGEPLPLEETYALRREFVRNRRQQQQARRQRTADEQAQRAARAMPRPVVVEPMDDLPIPAMADVGIHPLAGTTKAVRPRRRAADPVDGVAVEANDHAADADGSDRDAADADGSAGVV